MLKKNTLFAVTALFFLFLLVPAFGRNQQQELSIGEIMRLVAVRQEEAHDLRAAFVYRQDVLVRFHRTNGKLAREEDRRYDVTPKEKSYSKTLVGFQGRYEKDGKLIDYSTPGHKYKEVDIDGDLIDSLTDSMINEEHSRDGIAADLFPLTGKSQVHYDFKLHGQENYRGREVFKISFQPRRDKHQDWEQGIWEGELLVDVLEFQPVTITTHLAKGIPFVVRTLLGTNLKSLGFKLDYEKICEGIWFPVRYGGEFELKAVFFYKRLISVGLHSSDFRRAEVSTQIKYHSENQPPS